MRLPDLGRPRSYGATVRQTGSAAVTARAPAHGGRPAPDAATLEAFASELDALRRRTEQRLGAEDLAGIVALQRKVNWLKRIGRTLIHVGFDPLTLGAGIAALAAAKQLAAIEIDHAVLHGAFDRFDHPHLHSLRLRTDSPLHEKNWREVHGKHHAHTNIVGRDPDTHFGILRQSKHVPYRRRHRFQLVQVAASGLGVIGAGKGHRRAFSKVLPYCVKNFVTIPALAGPFFPKVLLANLAADAIHNLYFAATVYSGHISGELAVFPEETRARSKGEWYWMKAISTTNFDVPRPLSLLCGGLDRHVEHHFFPTLPPERLRQIAPEVRAICGRHGVPYNSATWPNVLAKLVQHLRAMSRPPIATSAGV